MDLRVYYKKIRETETSISEAFPVVVSQETPNGGKAGTKMEVPRRTAAKMIVDGTATLAMAEEAQSFRDEKAAAKQIADDAAAAARLQITLVGSDELSALRGKVRAS